MSFSLPKDLEQKARKRAKAQGTGYSGYIRELIEKDVSSDYGEIGRVADAEILAAADQFGRGKTLKLLRDNSWRRPGRRIV